jgi:hypothetical protein
MASSSTDERINIDTPVWNLIPINPHIFWIDNDLSHTGIGYHAYYANSPSKHEQPHPVYYHKTCWYHLFFDEQQCYLQGRFDALDALD